MGNSVPRRDELLNENSSDWAQETLPISYWSGKQQQQQKNPQAVATRFFSMRVPILTFLHQWHSLHRQRLHFLGLWHSGWVMEHREADMNVTLLPSCTSQALFVTWEPLVSTHGRLRRSSYFIVLHTRKYLQIHTSTSFFGQWQAMIIMMVLRGILFGATTDTAFR